LRFLRMAADEAEEPRTSKTEVRATPKTWGGLRLSVFL
jgi:hypothetical protein